MVQRQDQAMQTAAAAASPKVLKMVTMEICEIKEEEKEDLNMTCIMPENEVATKDVGSFIDS